MKKHLSAFERGRRIVVAMIAITILLSAATLLFTEDGSTERMVLTLAAFGGLIGTVGATLHFCRCPHCGKRILAGVMVATVCPKCRHSLITGEKVKKK
jgi:hypothetical protein